MNIHSSLLFIFADSNCNQNTQCCCIDVSNIHVELTEFLIFPQTIVTPQDVRNEIHIVVIMM